MNNSRQSSSKKPGFNWDSYIKSLSNQGINPSIARWYVIRAEQFLKAFPEQRLDEITAEQVTDYFKNIGRSCRLSDWQFRQIIDSIRRLFPYGTTNMENKIDWDY